MNLPNLLNSVSNSVKNGYNFLNYYYQLAIEPEDLRRLEMFSKGNKSTEMEFNCIERGLQQLEKLATELEEVYNWEDLSYCITPQLKVNDDKKLAYFETQNVSGIIYEGNDGKFYCGKKVNFYDNSHESIINGFDLKQYFEFEKYYYDHSDEAEADFEM